MTEKEKQAKKISRKLLQEIEDLYIDELLLEKAKNGTKTSAKIEMKKFYKQFKWAIILIFA